MFLSYFDYPSLQNQSSIIFAIVQYVEDLGLVANDANDGSKGVTAFCKNGIGASFVQHAPDENHGSNCDSNQSDNDHTESDGRNKIVLSFFDLVVAHEFILNTNRK